MASYDFIVIGAGSAGAVAAARLAEDPQLRVCLIEAGGRADTPLYRMPIMAGVLFRQKFATWRYHTQADAGLGGRSLFWPRGRGLGGSSAINGMIYLRGMPIDFDRWQAAGAQGWGWSDVLPYFERSVRYLADGEDFSPDGRVPVSAGRGRNPLYDAFLAAGAELGLPVSDDFNADPYGVGRFRFNIANGERWSTGRSHLSKARPNLKIILGAEVTRLVRTGNRVTGVEYLHQGAQETVHAGEVILSAGAINSPLILMRSGIGPAQDLRRHGIDIAADLPGVGQNLQDHLLIRVEHHCTQPVSLHSLMRLDRAALAGAQALITKTGPATSFPLEVGAYLKSDPAEPLADLQAQFLPGLSAATLRLPFLSAPSRTQGHGFFANIFVMRPESRGEIRLRSANLDDAPIITPRYLSHPDDITRTRAGVRRLREIFAASAFDAFRGVELAPGKAIEDDAALDAYIRAKADTVFHPSGTCKMGQDPMAVVDPELRVHGVAGLRVADASIMPVITSNNTNAPVIMIGERVAAFARG